MIELPMEFKQIIINRYEGIGIEWLNSVDKIIDKYQKKLNLHNIELIKNLTMNIVLFADSDKYGEVVVKIGAPGNTVISEINYMKLCTSKYFAKCYYYNSEDRVIVLERIKPGYQLNDLKRQEERISIFCNILNNITNDNIPKNNFKYHEEEVKERIDIACNNKKKYYKILYMVDTVNNFYNEIKSMNLPKYVLHDDLQHKNILKSNYGWKAIDPHGLVGEKIFETTYFIRAELEYTNLDEIDKIITSISKHLKEDKVLIYKALYINIFSKIVYYIKVKHDINFINYNIKICEEISKYIIGENKWI